MTTKRPAPPAPPVPLATSREVADHLRVDVELLANWRYQGRGPKFIKDGNIVRYSWAAVAQWIADQTCQRTDDVKRAAS